MQQPTTQSVDENRLDGLGFVQIVRSSYPTMAASLAYALEEVGITNGSKPPEGDASYHYVLLCADDVEDLNKEMERIKEMSSDAQIVVFGLRKDPSLA